MGCERHVIIAALLVLALPFQGSSLKRLNVQQWTSSFGGNGTNKTHRIAKSSEFETGMLVDEINGGGGLEAAVESSQAENTNSSSAPSFAVFVRAFWAELPYLGSFLNHYASLGVSKFYVVNNHAETHQEFKNFIRSVPNPKVHVQLISWFSGNAEAKKNANAIFEIDWLPRIKETFVIGVDVDEYLVLPKATPRLPDLVTQKHADWYEFYWLMVVNDGTQALHAPYTAFRGAEKKWMARTSALSSLGIHTPSLKGGAVAHVAWGPEGDGDVIHFWGRTIKDMITKSLAQTQSKSDGFRETCEMVKAGRLPKQLLLLAYLTLEQQRQEPVSVSYKGNDLLVVDYKLETQMLFRALKGQVANNDCLKVSQLQEVYVKFKWRLLQLEKEHGIHYPAYGSAANYGSLSDIGKWLREHEVA